MPAYVVVYMEEEKEYCYHFSKSRYLKQNERRFQTMWNSSLWEQENQEKIKAEYFDRLRAGTSDTYLYSIRRIICGEGSAQESEQEIRQEKVQEKIKQIFLKKYQKRC